MLRDEWSADPRKLAWHAVEAGAELVGREELAGLAEQAADLNLADYAFSDAAGSYEIAARHASGPSQIDFLIRQSDALRFCGRWREARDVLKRAAYLAGKFRLPEREAIALIHLERLTWTYGLDERELTQQLRNVMTKLPPGAQGLLAQVQGALALRLCIVPRQREDEQADLARAALQRLPAVTDSLARADILLGVRGGLQDNVSPAQLLEYGAQVLDNGVAAHSAYHIGEALEARITDLLRAGRISELPAALREHRDFLERSAAPTFHYYQALVDALLALARRDWVEAESAVKEGTRLSEEWGESMAGEALMAQAAWQLFETGETTGLTEFLDSLPTREVSSLNGPVWELGAGLIHAENGEAKLAIGSLRDVCGRTSDLRAIPRGPARSAILATAITVLGHPAVCEVLPADEAARLGAGAAGLLADHPDAFVLAGWPAVLLGSKHRYIGLAWLAAQQPERAERHLVQAADENRDFGVLQTRSQFDLARARMRLPGRYQRGRTELGRARTRAAALGMQGLVRQADAERERQPPPAG